MAGGTNSNSFTCVHCFFPTSIKTILGFFPSSYLIMLFSFNQSMFLLLFFVLYLDISIISVLSVHSSPYGIMCERGSADVYYIYRVMYSAANSRFTSQVQAPMLNLVLSFYALSPHVYVSFLPLLKTYM